jgi:DNA (cytosine-5)-methyltransferase 1
VSGLKIYKNSEGMKILNLYACLGGNRYLWGEEHEITAVELDPELARMYKERFPNDTVIVADAHQFLLEHYKEYDFIWTSPPCPTHSRIRFNQAKGRNDDVYKAEYPDMTLYQEILLLNNYFEGRYVVENVIPYYEPLIPAQKRGRHLYWCNFTLPTILTNRHVQVGTGTDEVKKLCEFHKIDLSSYKGEQRKDKIARNLVDFEAGKTILDTAMGIMRRLNTQQGALEFL